MYGVPRILEGTQPRSATVLTQKTRPARPTGRHRPSIPSIAKQARTQKTNQYCSEIGRKQQALSSVLSPQETLLLSPSGSSGFGSVSDNTSNDSFGNLSGSGSSFGHLDKGEMSPLSESESPLYKAGIHNACVPW